MKYYITIYALLSASVICSMENKLPKPEIIKKRLEEAGYSTFVEVTKIDEQLANVELPRAADSYSYFFGFVQGWVSGSIIKYNKEPEERGFKNETVLDDTVLARIILAKD